jgi:hypothetical protein
MTELITSPLRAGRHMVAWLVWHSRGVSLIADGEKQSAA